MIYIIRKGILIDVGAGLVPALSNHVWEFVALSNHHTAGSGNEAGGNGNFFASRRETRSNNMTGALPAVNLPGVERGYSGQFNFEQMVQSLHELFEHDRQTASQPDATRCGICYLHFSVSELQYQDDGFYLCAGCQRTLGNHKLPMLRRQQKL